MNKILVALSCLLLYAGSVEAEHCCRHGQGGKPQEDPSGGRPGHRPGPHHGGSGHWEAPYEAASLINPVPFSTASVAKGRATYLANCTLCHGEYGMGDGPAATSLPIRPSNLRHTARHDLDGEMAWKIYTGRDPMPAWKHTLTEQQVWELVNFVRAEFGHGRGGRHSHGRQGRG